MAHSERVVIVGAGPVGLVTALALARLAVPVLVLEAESQLAQDERGAAFHPPTLEILERLGVIEDVRGSGLMIPIWQIRDRDAGVIASFDLSILASETRYPYRFHLGQQYLTAILLKHLETYPKVEVRFNARAVGVEQGLDHVSVTIEAAPCRESIQGKWLVGADGGRSAIRKALGINFEGYTWPERFVVNNVNAELERYGLSYANYVTNPESWAVVLKLGVQHDDPVWRVTYPADGEVSDEALLHPENIQRRLHDFVPNHGLFSVRHTSIYRVHQRVAASFRKGRALLAGDSAHINNPLGGFGLNSGIHDAFNLAEKLAAVWRGEAREDLLDRYERQRRHANVTYIQSSSIRNKKILEEQEPARRRVAQEELRQTVGDPVRAKAYMLNSSMITSVREAALIE